MKISNNKIKINKVINRFLPINKSVLKGLESEPKITDFTIIKLLGIGTFSKVYLAQHNKTKAQYAIKTIDKRNIENKNEIDYLKREAEIMYRINHPNIVKLYGHFEDNTYCYLIMEYMSKGDAYSLLIKNGNKKLNDQIIVSILKDIISATYYLHHMIPPIIHRDIKLENILFNSQMNAKLTDFGWSNYLKKDHMKRMTFAGTPVYLAPELVNNFGHDNRVDIWCIGVLMFELLAGHPPWMGEDVQTLKYNISRMKIKWQKHMAPDAVDLIQKTLRYNPEERISLRNMLMHPFFTKYYPNAVNSLIRPDGKKPKICIISKDNPQLNFFSVDYINSANNNYNISANNNNNNYSYSNNISYNYQQKNEISMVPNVKIEQNSYPMPTLQQSNYIPSYDKYNNNNIFNNNISTEVYSNSPLSSLQIQELVDNQKRIDELVLKPEKNEIKKGNYFHRYNLSTYDFNNTFNLYNNNNEIYNPSSSFIYKTESPLVNSFNMNNDITYNNEIKYSLPPKYDIKTVKYNKPKIVYSSMTAKRTFEGNQYENRTLKDFYIKYRMDVI